VVLLGPGRGDHGALLQEAQRQLEETAFPRRAHLIAAAVAREAPDLVGLQEVCLWCADGEVLWDYEAELLAALARRGVPYEPVVSQSTFRGSGEVELGGRGVRLEVTGANTILRRADSPVRPGTTATGLFGDAFALPLTAPRLEATLERGWCAVRCTLEGDPSTAFAFVDTHTEAYDDVSRDLQRDELLTGLTDDTPVVVLVGDFNAVPERVGMPEGFVDAWDAAGNPSGAEHAATCCQAADLANPRSALRDRIDYVFVRGARVVSAARIGADPEDRSANGLWPSDHAGVVAELELRS
jgi:hypothetical protein